jgi:hypothetical protein
MGVDLAFGTMADRWANKMEKRGKEAARRMRESGEEI